MRILYLCQRVPYPLTKGDKIRACRQLMALSKAHEVDLFTLADDPEDLKHETALTSYCRTVTISNIVPSLARILSFRVLGSGLPLTLPYFHSGSLASKVRRALLSRSYDRIFVYCSSMLQYVEWLDGLPIITDLVDVDSDKWRQYAQHTTFPMSAIYRREAKCLREYERTVCGKSSMVLVTTKREERLVGDIDSTANVHVVPNGVDSDYFNVTGDRKSTTPMIVFTGDMSYFPNQEGVIFFCHKVLPLIRRVVAEARFIIVGRNPSRRIQRLEALPGVEVTGFVPDVRTYLSKARLSLVPLSIAAGIQNKILEAMACGVPVIATSRAVQGLSPNVGSIIQTGDTADEIAENAIPFLKNPDLAYTIGLEGRRRVVAEYNWNQTSLQLLDLIEKAGENASSINSLKHTSTGN